MYASVSRSTALGDDFEVAARPTPDGRLVVTVHATLGIYLSLSPDEATVLHAQLGHVLADLAADQAADRAETGEAA